MLQISTCSLTYKVKTLNTILQTMGVVFNMLCFIKKNLTLLLRAVILFSLVVMEYCEKLVEG